MIVTTKNVKETYTLGLKIAGNLRPGLPVLLYGELGAGKTELVKGICAGLGYKGRVLSPTFQIVRTYSTAHCRSSTIKQIYHIDLYRIDQESDFVSLGLDEYFLDDKAVVLLEWADRLLENALPKKYKKVTIEAVSENERRFAIIDVSS